MSDNWREAPNDGELFFRNAKKRADIERRRPVIRRASDLVGPGIAENAVPVTNWNDLLATYNGYYSSGNLSKAAAADGRGALGGPQPLPSGAYAGYDFNPYVGFTTMDDVLGGTQRITDLLTGRIYSRIFLRNPSDPSSVLFGAWKWENEPPVIPVVLPREMGYIERTSSVTTTNTSLYGGTVIPGLSLTVTGEGTPVELIFDGLLSQSVSGTNPIGAVGAWFVVNGSSSVGPGSGYVGFTGQLGAVNVQRTLLMSRRAVLLKDTQYTFTVGWYCTTAGTASLTATAAYPASLRINRLG